MLQSLLDRQRAARQSAATLTWDER